MPAEPDLSQDVSSSPRQGKGDEASSSPKKKTTARPLTLHGIKEARANREKLSDRALLELMLDKCEDLMIRQARLEDLQRSTHALVVESTGNTWSKIRVRSSVEDHKFTHAGRLYPPH